MGKRQEAALLTRQKIIDALIALRTEKSADDINIEDIAQSACIAKGSYYTHFLRKEDAIAVIAFESYVVTSKLWLSHCGYAREKVGIERSLKKTRP